MNATVVRRLVPLAGFVLAGLAGTAMAATDGAAAAVAAKALNSPARVAAFAELPDWSGYWEQFHIGPSGVPAADEVSRDTGGAGPVFTPYWQQEMAKEKKHNRFTDRNCVFGFPTLLESSPLVFQVINVPGQTTMIFNDQEVRSIYTDGKGHTPDDVRISTPWGDSVGHWEGATLYIDTVGTLGRLWFHNDKGGLDNTLLDDQQTVYHERLHRVDPDTLEDDFTVESPGALAKPYHFTRRYHRNSNLERMVLELDCLPQFTNDRNPQVNGKWTLSGPRQ